MSPVNLTSALVVGGIYTAGTYLLLQRSLMRVLIGLVLLGHGTNLLLLLVGGESGAPPMVGSAAPERMSDPLPQGMALTSIVITFALTTFLLALAYRAWTLLGDDEVRDDVEDARISRLERRAVERGSGTPPGDGAVAGDGAVPAREPSGDQASGDQASGDSASGDPGLSGDLGVSGDLEAGDGTADPEVPGDGTAFSEPGELAVPGLLERLDPPGRRP